MAPAKREPSGLTNVDGSPPLQACTNARKWLQEHYPDPVIIAIQYYADAQQRRSVGNGFDRALDATHWTHLQNCSACKQWITAVAGTRDMHRQRRLSQYCCAGLFAAVEETGRGGLSIGLTRHSPANYEGAHNWRLTVAGDETRTLLINYCPFCGQLIKTAPVPD